MPSILHRDETVWSKRGASYPLYLQCCASRGCEGQNTAVIDRKEPSRKCEIPGDNFEFSSKSSLLLRYLSITAEAPGGLGPRVAEMEDFSGLAY